MSARHDRPTVAVPEHLAASVRALVRKHGLRGAARLLGIAPNAAGNLGCGGRVDPLTFSTVVEFLEAAKVSDG